MNIRLAKEIECDSIVDGDGLRAVIWAQGCSHNCKGCHNPITHAFDGGFVTDTNELKKQISELKHQDGITLSGGDPFFQAKAFGEIAKYIKSIGLNVWAYTGFTFEELMRIADHNEDMLELLENIDVLVDGRFVEQQKSLNLLYKGSKNQRILDVKESLKQNKAIEIVKYKAKKEKELDYGRRTLLYI